MLKSYLNFCIIDIYTLVDSCYYDNSIVYVPILLEIKNEEVRKAFDDRRYLLQVWNKDTSKKIYESSLTCNSSSNL